LVGLALIFIFFCFNHFEFLRNAFMKPSSSLENSPEKLPRNLGLWGIWMLVVNGLIGAGIFGLPSGAAALAGEYSILIYAFCALLILPVILCFAELGSYFRGTGGPIKYGTLAFGPFIGFQGG
jgi:amino acid transporter